VAKHEGKRTLGRLGHRWVDNKKIDHQNIGCGSMDWIELVQDRDRWRALANAVINLWVPKNAEEFLTSLETVSFFRSSLLHAVGRSVLLHVTKQSVPQC
jgi:hypothetical protein